MQFFETSGGALWRKVGIRLVGLAMLVGAVTLGALHMARQNAQSDLDEQMNRSAQSYVAAIEGWQQQYWALAAIYAEDPSFARINSAPNIETTGLQNRLNRWNAATGTQATLVVRSDGSLVAGAYASIFPDGDTSIIPRQVLKTASDGGLGRGFVVWPNGYRGYAFAYEVSRNAGDDPLIVVVIASLYELQKYVQLQVDTIFVTDGRGGIAVANQRGATGRTVAEALADDRFAALYPRGAEVREVTDTRSSWHVIVAKSRAEALEYVRLVGWLAAISTLAVALLGLLVLSRRSALQERLDLQRTMRRELEETVKCRTSELTEANRDLQAEIARRHVIEKDLRETHLELTQAAKLASVGQMSAVVSHELNQPLTAIRSNAELAREYLDRSATEQANAKIGAILDMTDRIAKLTKRLLNFSRQPRSDVYPVALALPLDDALGILEPRIVKQEAVVEVDLLPDLFVNAGRNRLSQVFINLIANALDACSAGADPCAINIASFEKDGQIEISFSDNGPGVPDDRMARIFDAFYSTKERGEGLGLGLSVSMKIIEEFGGSLQYRRGENGGAVFVVALPLLARRDEAA
ncbi:sensor histidine kinase [Qipengyuania gelatinilytica]|uniref:histidine kinase n=1 Tax=Qipengyuania gelatinilytica TaxID=2867231 RepID=A0ABX9A4E0_9SPHN|nr:ATP-binding protein [Qipengyuania gelatinilytica]QZD96135.1 hypothetical protein K3136_05390 [Qipengyuania gelatinilytica]